MTKLDIDTALKDRAIFNPFTVFRKPAEILDDNLLKNKKIPMDITEKKRALQTWEYDTLIQLNAVEENMQPQRSAREEQLLEEIKKALTDLEPAEAHRSAPNKFGSL